MTKDVSGQSENPVGKPFSGNDSQDIFHSKEYLRLILESAKDFAIFAFDTERRVNSWNAGAELMMGYTENEIIGELADVIFVPEDRADNTPEMEAKKAREEGRAENERWHMRKDGTRFYGSGLVRPLLNSEGVLLGYVKVMRDLTEAKKAQEALLRSEDRLKKAISIETVGIVFFNMNGEITQVNNAFLQMCGYEPHAMSTSKLQRNDYTPADFMAQSLTANEELMKTGRTTPYQKQYLCKDGSQRWALFAATRISEDEGVEYIIDITEQKALEQQKDEFIGIASHELRTPVTSIKAYTELLEEVLKQKGDLENILLAGKLNEQVNRLTHLLHALLDTTNISEGQLKLQFQNFDINQLVEEQMDEWALLSPRHSISFAKGELKHVLADRERIGQVITNLISNAVKYSPAGGQVHIESAAVKDGVKISIRDYGIGMSPELQQRIFERFYRGQADSVAAPGLGLGLYIVSEIIKRHKGTLGVESIPGKGSVFYFTLP